MIDGSSEFITRMAETFRPDGTQDEAAVMQVIVDMGVDSWEQFFRSVSLLKPPSGTRAAAEDMVLSARSYLAGNDI